MERCGFFDAELVGESYDRTYVAEQFAAYFASFIGNGVFGGKSDELQVVAMETPSMQIAVLPGQGWINGYWYENTSDLYLPIDVADGVFDRIDSIVLRFGSAERNMWIDVRKGVPSSNPVVPSLVRNADYYELQLATIRVKAGALSIRQSDISDTRLDSNVCGFVVSVVNQFDTSSFYAQIESIVKQLEEVLSEGDVGPLMVAIEQLKSLSIESDEYPGCYYRVVDGNVEWINPPAEPGVEYRLTERFEDKTVFQSLINIASLPNASRAIIATNFTFTKVLSCQGIMMNGPSAIYAEAFPFPVYKNIGAAPVAMINGVTTGIGGRNIVVSTTEDLTDYRANITIKYVK